MQRRSRRFSQPVNELGRTKILHIHFEIPAKMSKAEMAQNVFRSLLKELGASISEEAGEGFLTLKSEEWKFALNVHSGEDGKFDKAVLEKPAEGGECFEKFEAVVDALTELLKAFSCSDKPEVDAKPEGKGKEPEEEAKEPEDEAKEPEVEAKEPDVEAKEPEVKEEKSDESKESEAKEEQPSDA